MKRIVSLCLLIIMMASVLVSCSDAKNEDEGVCGLPTEDTETEALGTEASSEENVETEAAAVGYELSNFVIVYGDVCNMKIATDLRAKFESEYKVTLAMRKATEKNEAELEIIIGDSPRAVSSPCFDPLNTKYLTAYGIVCDNGKVQLLGIDRATIDASVEYFIANCINKETSLVTLPEKGEVIEEITHESISIPTKSDDSYIRLVTNNILSQYINSSWDRLLGLVGAYVYIDADIYALQEVDKPWHSTYGLTERMKWLGYDIVTDNASAPCPIFYKTEKFDLVKGGYNKYDVEALSGTEDKYYAWACLKEKSTGKKLIVISTHLIASGNGMTTEEKNNRELHRQACAGKLVEIVDKLKAEHGATAAIVTGDFNSYTTSVVYATMSSAMFSARDNCESRVNMIYNTPTSLGKVPEQTDRFIDHVFYTKTGISAKHFETVVSPYTYAYSDHVPVVFDFALN